MGIMAWMRNYYINIGTAEKLIISDGHYKKIQKEKYFQI